MRIIALTGGIACGKSTVAGWLRELGASVIDADQISRQLTAPGGEALPAIRRAFGDGVMNRDGSLCREALAGLVFASEEDRVRLNALLHPMIQRQMESQMEKCRKNGASIVVLDVPLLYEAGMESMADFVVCVAAPEELQLSRLENRDGLTRAEALARIRSQWPVAQKALLADATLWTDRPEAQVRGDVERLYAGLLERSKR